MEQKLPGLSIQKIELNKLQLYYGRYSPAGNFDFRDMLPAEEMIRSDRMKNQGDRYTFLACRAALRLILGYLTDVSPDRVFLQYHPSGKPYIEGLPLDFSISHTDQAFLLGFNHGGSIGVDMEIMPSTAGMPAMAAYAFSETEMKYCGSGSIPEKFLEIWTTKEAMLKALGKGITVDLKSMCTIGKLPVLFPGEEVQRELFSCPGGETGSAVYTWSNKNYETTHWMKVKFARFEGEERFGIIKY